MEHAYQVLIVGGGLVGASLAIALDRAGVRTALVEAQFGAPLHWEKLLPLSGKGSDVPAAPMVTLRIDAGRTDKLRPGDIVGALTGEAGLHKDAVGKIDVFATRSYVAIARGQVGRALGHLQGGKIKGRRFRIARM